jgi:hypothetical protein
MFKIFTGAFLFPVDKLKMQMSYTGVLFVAGMTWYRFGFNKLGVLPVILNSRNGLIREEFPQVPGRGFLHPGKRFMLEN